MLVTESLLSAIRPGVPIRVIALPHADSDNATAEQRIAAIDGYSVVDAVPASMSLPFYFRSGHYHWTTPSAAAPSAVDTMHVSATDFGIDTKPDPPQF